ncbi:hypothetical protein MSAN_00610800 [Mycena sanguinolenta]|uniref:Alpha-type protein kinase domain-containing protein n=1 Tax=Mycena sanguinolenta TaxID=230812 RepID=A0A8H6Z7I8_9AGAR|nr:hypothetical protein MSAN_00610800 [Mycena sanguinolenta]
MANRTSKKIQPAAKETVNNSATVFEGSRKIFVHMVASCQGTEAANVLVVVARHFPETVSFNSALEDLLLRWKSDWDSRCTESLTSEFIVPRFYKNFNPEPDSTLGTLGEFYDQHHLLPNTQRAKCFALPSNMKLQPPYIYLEARILVEEFEAKKGCSAPSFVLTPKQQKKRKSNFEETNIQAKKLRGTTSFLGTYTDILVATATTEVDEEAGKVSTTYPVLDDPELTAEKCEIAKEVVSKGMSQYVYKGIFRKEPSAFKRFFNEAHIEIDEDISVTHCQLVFEVTKEGEAPSTASGYSLSDMESAQCPMVWLVEPFRLGRAEKWSGTNEHPNHSRNKLGNILNAFAHFVHDASYKSTALADIQTMKARIGNRVSQVLFDLTTHTSSGDSGVGDHGQDGIDTFVEQHVCTARCESLGLVPMGDQDTELEEEDDNE